MRNTISLRLIRTLRKGKSKLGADALLRIISFVESQRTEADTFVNKNGEVDLYYTSFGWVLSFVLGIPLDTRKMALYLAEQPVDNLDLVHYAAFMRCLLMHRLLEDGKMRFLLNTFRSTPVKGLARFDGFPHDDPEAPYARFIWLSLQEDTGNKIEDKKIIIDTLSRYRVANGGYSNIKDRNVATTNATVAALSIIGQLKGYTMNEDLFYLRGTQEECGGFKGGETAPVPDLLSTATSLFVLRCYNQAPIHSARDFVEAHWLDSGGFVATLWDNCSDVEYTFYGLLALGAL